MIPYWLSERWPALAWSLLITALTVGVVTLVLGRQTGEDALQVSETGWLERSRERLPPLREHPFANQAKSYDWIAIVCAAALLLGSCYVVFVTFW